MLERLPKVRQRDDSDRRSMGVRIAGITGQRVVHIMSMLQCVCRWKSAARGPRRECAADKTMLERCVLERLPKCASATIPINVHGGAHDHAPRCPLIVNLTIQCVCRWFVSLLVARGGNERAPSPSSSPPLVLASPLLLSTNSPLRACVSSPVINTNGRNSDRLRRG